MAEGADGRWQEMWNVNFAASPPCPCWPERLSRRRTATVAGVKNYTSISCHSFLLSPSPPVAEQANQLAQDAQEDEDQIKGVEHGASPMVRLGRIIGQGGGRYMLGYEPPSRVAKSTTSG